jgi:hypothetical protein
LIVDRRLRQLIGTQRKEMRSAICSYKQNQS